jgi:anti-sigma regulatory factor (Ser/Thr protein kinase)
MLRTWQIDSGDYESGARARKEFSALIHQTTQPGSDCQAAVLIFGELMANALTHGRGTVQACVSRGAQHAILWVEDAGAGFALEGVAQPVRGQVGGRGILIVKALARSIRAGRVEDERFRVTVELPIRLASPALASR